MGGMIGSAVGVGRGRWVDEDVAEKGQMRRQGRDGGARMGLW